jgi:hypothetical protein
VAETGEFAGFTGLSIPRFDAPFMPAVEIGDFDHPLVPEGSPGRRHWLYRITASTWRARPTA